MNALRGNAHGEHLLDSSFRSKGTWHFVALRGCHRMAVAADAAAAGGAGCVLNHWWLGAAAAAALGSLPGQPAGMPSALGPPTYGRCCDLHCKHVSYRACRLLRTIRRDSVCGRLSCRKHGLDCKNGVPLSPQRRRHIRSSSPPAGLTLHLQQPALLPAARAQHVPRPAPGRRLGTSLLGCRRQPCSSSVTKSLVQHLPTKRVALILSRPRLRLSKL